MYSVESGKNLVITDEDKAVVQSLIEASRAEEKKQSHEDMGYEHGKVVLSMLLHGKGWDTGVHLKSGHFEDISHGAIFKVLRKSWVELGAVPPVEWLQGELKSSTNAKDLALLHLGELEAIRMRHEHEVYPAEEWVRKFLKNQGVKLALTKAVDEVKKGPEAVWKALEEAKAEWDTLGEAPVLLDYDAWRKTLPKEGPDWIVTGLIASGEVSMVTALPWGGKSTLLAEGMADVAQGKDWLHYSTQPASVVYLNMDRQAEDMIDGRIMPHVTDYETLKKRLFVVPAASLPTVLTVGYLRQLIADVRKRTGLQRVWLVVDTLRSGLLSKKEDGSENDATAMVGVLVPVREMAVEEKVAVTVVHHNNRHSDDYAGSAAIKGMVDTFVRVRREQDSSVATVSLSSRRGVIREVKVSRAEDGTLSIVEALADEGAAEDPKAVRLLNVAKAFGEGRTVTDAFRFYNDLAGEDKAMTSGTFRRDVQRARDGDMLGELAEGSGRSGTVFRFVAQKLVAHR